MRWHHKPEIFNDCSDDIGFNDSDKDITPESPISFSVPIHNQISTTKQVITNHEDSKTVVPAKIAKHRIVMSVQMCQV